MKLVFILTAGEITGPVRVILYELVPTKYGQVDVGLELMDVSHIKVVFYFF